MEDIRQVRKIKYTLSSKVAITVLTLSLLTSLTTFIWLIA